MKDYYDLLSIGFFFLGRNWDTEVILVKSDAFFGGDLLHRLDCSVIAALFVMERDLFGYRLTLSHNVCHLI